MCCFSEEERPENSFCQGCKGKIVVQLSLNYYDKYKSLSKLNRNCLSCSYISILYRICLALPWHLSSKLEISTWS